MDHGQCLTEETLTDYLEGGLDPAIKAVSEVHLIGCDECRVRLGFFMRLLNEEVAPEEAETIQVIAREWEKKTLSDRMPGRARKLRSWIVTMAAVAAVLVVALIPARYALDRALEPKAASEVVQLLLAQKRPFEFRLSNQPHLPIVRTRSLDDAGLEYGLLAGQMTRLSADSHEMGRFYLLQKDFKRAIAYLEMAEREVGVAAAVHNDLGVAYLENGDEDRFERAAREFGHALDSNPESAAAIFNLAVLAERAGETPRAASHWRRYLELDSSSPWADEARSRLQGLSR